MEPYLSKVPRQGFFLFSRVHGTFSSLGRPCSVVSDHGMFQPAARGGGEGERVDMPAVSPAVASAITARIKYSRDELLSYKDQPSKPPKDILPFLRITRRRRSSGFHKQAKRKQWMRYAAERNPDNARTFIPSVVLGNVRSIQNEDMGQMNLWL